jgi:hypothetical protein
MTATVSPELNVAEALRTGPASILDFHVGSLDDLRAPDWVHWTRNTLEFRQLRAGFISLFSQMALWVANLDQVSVRELTCWYWVTY